VAIKDIALADHGLTMKRQAFVHAYLENGGNATDAYRRSHNCEKMSDAAIRVEACRLLRHPNITLTIESFRKSKIADTLLTLDEHMAELRDLRDVAKAGGHLSAAVKAEELRGKLRGFYVDKVERGSPNEFANMTDEELHRCIAEEAQALGMTVTIPSRSNGGTKH
jgi:hypothetical protein